MAFQAFFDLVELIRTSAGVEQPSLPRKRKVPRHIDDENGGAYFSETVEDHYCLQYFEALDLALVSIRDRFDQPGYAVYCKLEELLLKGAAGSDFSEQLREVSGIYHEIDASQLEVQLSNLATYFQKSGIAVSLQESASITCEACLQLQRLFYSEVCTLAHIILVMPASNAVSERSFSVMRQINSYLRNTMVQARLDHLVVLNIYKEQLDKFDLMAIANGFVSGNEVLWQVYLTQTLT